MRNTLMALVGIVPFAMGTSAGAHHSYSMFDRTKTSTVSGTVKELQWTNPHVWLQVLVADGGGQPVEYGFESAGPAGLGRAGWTRSSLKPGDKVTVRYNPLRNGAPGGNLDMVTTDAGLKLGVRAGSDG